MLLAVSLYWWMGILRFRHTLQKTHLMCLHKSLMLWVFL